MRKNRAFRPLAAEARLEDRVVLNGGPIQLQDARQVLQAFATFRQGYVQAVNMVLYAKDSSGTINPSAHRAAFDMQVGTLLNTLNTSIDTATSNLAGASTLDATIMGQLLGTGSTTLQGQLAALTTPADASRRGERMFVSASDQDIFRAGVQVEREVLNATPPGGNSLQTIRQDVSQVQKAYGTFAQGYSQAIRNVLLKPGSDGTVNPSANRAAFDQQVGTLLDTLSSSVTTTLGNLNGASTLISNVQAAISGGSDSLKTRLAGIATPSSGGFFATLLFRVRSSLTIARSDGQVMSMILAFGRTSNGG